MISSAAFPTENKTTCASIFCLFLCLVYTSVLAQQKLTYARQEYMIPMRDGIKLYTVVYAPDSLKGSFPILIQRNPYGSEGTGSPDKSAQLRDLAAKGYIFVMQDIRGRYKSEGKFVMNRPVLDKAGEIDESTDTYDAVDWLIHNIPNNNGKVGQLGISYLGWTTLAGAARPHPAMKAASEQACMGDLFLGDDFHHNGAFRLSYAFDYTFMEESSKKDSSFQFDQYDMYTWFLSMGPLANANKLYFHGKIPSWNLFIQHPNYDSFWQFQSPLRYMDYPRIPMLHVGGIWDQEDMNGPQLMYASMEKRDSNNRNFICLGPWIHGIWAADSIWKLDRYIMGSNTSGYFQRNIQQKWFDYWLRGEGDGKFPEATIFQTGSNQWKTYTSWPPKEAAIKRLYLAGSGKLSFQKPIGDDPAATGSQAASNSATAAHVYDEYISDPKNPVPYRPRPIEQTYGSLSRWYLWLLGDQRFVDGRPDVATWQTDTLMQNETITGSVIAHLFASTTGSDADFVVKLIDVYPGIDKEDMRLGGYEFMIASEIFRGRYRKSFSRPEAIIPGKVEEFTIGLHQVDHVFLKGHRIMVQVQSSWFPQIDMNPQKFVLSIYDAKAEDYQKATMRIYRSGRFATYLEFPQIAP